MLKPYEPYPYRYSGAVPSTRESLRYTTDTGTGSPSRAGAHRYSLA